MNNYNYKIGFCCKFITNNKELQEKTNTKTTTITWLNNQPKKDAENRLESILNHNVDSIGYLLNEVSKLPPNMHMLRISSDILPAYTHPNWAYFYQTQKVKNILIDKLSKIGSFAKEKNIKLSFHPGQFVCLASDRADVVENSIKEFEYHTDLIRYMGYGLKFMDFKCNIHASGKLGVEGLRNVYKRLSQEARNTITLENDEKVYGLDEVLKISETIPIVMDIHHHWCKTNEYIQSNDKRVIQVIDSWRGVRPTMHYSYSRNEYLKDNISFPCINERMSSGISRGKLYAHSDSYPNKLVNSWASSFIDNFDIACEAKFKNIASKELYDFINLQK
jgi:UV DNA damage endonuclease